MVVSHSVQDVASALGLDSRKFFYVVQNCDDGRYYRKFTVPKKSGGVRSISQPQRGLALAQSRLAEVLESHYRIRPYVKGYVKGTSFIENARYHQNQRWVLNVDIKDFFPSIGFARVRGLFLSSVFGFNPRVATILARVCTFEDALPQGARTSPILANFIAHNLDKRIIAIASSERIKYSRYADDLTFSSSHRRIPVSLVGDTSGKSSSGAIVLGAKLEDAFARAGFKINEKKTRLQLRHDRQEVTGLIVNRDANVWRKDIARLRMKLYSAKKFGLEEASKIWVDGKGPEKFKAHIIGWLAYLRQVRGKKDPVLAKLCKQAFEAGFTEIEWITETAEMVREFDVFLSHASEDKPRMRRLKDKLEEQGMTVFFDEDSIQWGESIVEKINIGLLKSSYFVPFLTETFANKGWTNKELNSAISMNASQKGRILPIKDANFILDERYPLLNETVYKIWPADSTEEENFVSTIADAILALVEKEKQAK